MANHGQELSSIDFESMIGGPLIAVVNAQAQAAMSSVQFIKEAGFKRSEDDGPNAQATNEPIYVTFKYPKEITPYRPPVEEERDEDGNIVTEAQDEQAAVWDEMKLTVPILTMLPIPFIRIEETTIDFNAKINSIESRERDSSFQVGGSFEAKAGWGWGSAKLKVSSSYQSKTRQGSETKRTYSLAVHVRAVQDEMPAGMERLLGILENAIASQPTSAPPPASIPAPSNAEPAGKAKADDKATAKAA